MNIETMQIFCDLVELRNFSRAAEKHHISQSAVSQQLAQLELGHKCQFINRNKRPLTLTGPGEIFYHACKDMLDRYDRLNSELISLNKSTTKINIAAIFSIGMHTLQPYVKKFMAKYPKTNLSIEYLDSAEIYERILKGSIDIGVVAIPRKDRNIDVYPFESEQLVFVCSREHKFANNAEMDIHLLQGQKFIAFEDGVPTRNLVGGILSQYSVTVRTVMEFDNIETIKRAVEINAGVSILPETAIRAELANGTIAAMSFSNEFFLRPTGVIVRKNREITLAERYLIELLRKRAY